MQEPISNSDVASHIRTSHSRIATTYYGGIGHGVPYYRNSALAYERWEDRMFSRIFSAIFEQVGINPEARFLDAGCGNGQWLEYFHRYHGFRNFTAVDFSSDMLAVARERMRYVDDIQAEYLQADLEKIPVGSETTDIVHMFGVMDHLVDPSKVLNELHRILNKGGYLILNAPIRYSFCHWSNLAFGISPEYWGVTPKSKLERVKMILDFKSKMKHYKYYEPRELHEWLYPGFEILQQHASSYSYAVSFPGIPYRKLPGISFALQDVYDAFIRVCFLNHPAGMYFLCRKK